MVTGIEREKLLDALAKMLAARAEKPYEGLITDSRKNPQSQQSD